MALEPGGLQTPKGLGKLKQACPIGERIAEGLGRLEGATTPAAESPRRCSCS